MSPKKGHSKKVNLKIRERRNFSEALKRQIEHWFLDRSYDLLPVKYFHGVFTVLSELRNLFRYNKKLLYSLLFKCSWETIKEFWLDKRQKMMNKTGMISILHTWNQRMLYTIHICIVSFLEGELMRKASGKRRKGSRIFYSRLGLCDPSSKRSFYII
jgi:hypothetical protein